MDKDLIKLQKEINLHVADIKRIQGLMSKIGISKGQKADELRRLKDKSRKTQAFLSESKKVKSSNIPKGDMTMSSPEKSMKQQTLVSGGASASGGRENSQAGIIIDLILFGQSAAQKRGLNMTASLGQTVSSGGGPVSQVYPLQYILLNSQMTRFDIADTNTDGSQRSNTQLASMGADDAAESQGSPEKKGKKKTVA